MAIPQHLLDFLGMSGAHSLGGQMGQPVQEPEPDMARSILSERFQPGWNDVGNSALASVGAGQYVDPQSFVDARIGNAIKQIATIGELQKNQAMAKLYAAGGSGSQTLKLVQAVNEDRIAQGLPPLSTEMALAVVKSPGALPMMANPQGTGLMNTPGSVPVATSMEQGKQTGTNISDLQYKPDIARDTKLAENDAAKQAGYAKAQSALAGYEQQSKLVTSTVDNVLKTVFPGQDINVILADKGTLKPSNWSTGYGVALSSLPNTDARKVQNYLNTIKANIGFDKLQAMRDNSPTGGALGQVSDFENKLLQAVNGALDPAQADQFVENMKEIRRLYPMVLAERQRAFQTDYGRFGGGAAPMGTGGNSPQNGPVNFQPMQQQGDDGLPSPAQHAGRTITDTQTGQKYKSDGSQWVPQR